MKNRIMQLVIVGIILVGIISCSNPLSSQNKNIETLEGDKGSLTINLDSQVQSKTVTPSYENVVDYYTISGNGPSGETIEEHTFSPGNTISNLVVGDWTITVNGKDTDDATVAQGETTVSITSGENTANIDVTYLQEGSGSIEINISWPASAGVDSVVPLFDGSIESDVYDGDESCIYTKNNVSSGDHKLVFTLKSGNNIRATVTEAVQVFDNQTSSADINLSEDQIASPPQAPSNLQANLTTDGNVELTWDASGVTTETGFIIERDTTDVFSNPSEITVTGANVVTYEDTAASLGETYYYRIASQNDFGQASWINSNSILVENNSSLTEVFFDDFEDGALSGDPTWAEGGTDQYTVSVYDNNGDYVLRIPRGGDYGSAHTDIDVNTETDDFVLEFETEYFGDSLGRPRLRFIDDSGKYALRWYANTYQDELSASLYNYDEITDSYDTTTICTVEYNSSNSNHTYKIEKIGTEMILYEDGVEMCRGEIPTSAIDEWNDQLTTLELRAHGSFDTSGVYYDDVRFETSSGGSTTNDNVRKLTLSSTTVNGTTQSVQDPSFTVTAGETIDGSFTVGYEHNMPSSHVLPLAVTPDWGDKTSVYWEAVSDMSDGGSYTESFSLTAPTTPGTYHLILANHSEYTAAQILSATHHTDSSVTWDDGNDLYDLSDIQLATAQVDGMLMIEQLADGTYSNKVYGVTAIEFVVEESLSDSAIVLKQSSTEIANGDYYYYTDELISASATAAAVTFTIENTGTGTLNLSGDPTVSLEQFSAIDFSPYYSVSPITDTDIEQGNNIDFDISLNAAQLLSENTDMQGGSVEVSVSIPNNDSANEDFIFTLFEVINYPPDIEFLYSWDGMEISYGDTYTFGLTGSFGTTDGDTEEISWYVDGVEQTGETGDTFDFSRTPQSDTSYEIKAVCTDGTDTDEAIVTVVVKREFLDETPPGEVSPLTSTAGDGEVSLSWSDPLDSDLDHIEITWSPADGDIQPKTISADIGSATVTGLTNGTSYIFTVKTVDTAGNTSLGMDETAKPISAGEVKWSFTTGGFISSSPAISTDGTIYVGSYDGNVYALNPDGTEKWSYFISNYLGSTSPAIASDGTIYVGSDNSNIYAINPDGTEKWHFSTGRQVLSSPAIATDGTVYIGSSDNNLYALNPNGTERWRFSTGNSVKSDPAIASDGTIYFGSGDGNVYAINPDGTEKWSFGTGSYVTSSPAIASDGTIYIGSWDYNVYALNPNGTEKWSYLTGHSVESNPAIDSDGTIYVGSNDSNIYALSSDGTKKWSFKTGGYVESSPAIASDGTIYVCSSDNNVYALNPDGTERWSFVTGGYVESSPAVATDGTIYVGGTSDSNVYALNGVGGGLMDSEWPMFGNNLRHNSRVSN